LQSGTGESHLEGLFKDVRARSMRSDLIPHLRIQCGAIREIKISSIGSSVVATVEFTDSVSCTIISIMRIHQASGNRPYRSHERQEATSQPGNCSSCGVAIDLVRDKLPGEI